MTGSLFCWGFFLGGEGGVERKGGCQNNSSKQEELDKLSYTAKSSEPLTWQKVDADKVPKATESITQDPLWDGRGLADDEETLSDWGIIIDDGLREWKHYVAVVNPLHAISCCPHHAKHGCCIVGCSHDSLRIDACLFQ